MSRANLRSKWSNHHKHSPPVSQSTWLYNSPAASWRTSVVWWGLNQVSNGSVLKIWDYLLTSGSNVQTECVLTQVFVPVHNTREMRISCNLEAFHPCHQARNLCYKTECHTTSWEHLTWAEPALAHLHLFVFFLYAMYAWADLETDQYICTQS